MPVYAQLLLEEGKKVHSVKPGETIVDSLNAHNTAGEEISIKAYWEDFVYIPPFDGQKKFFPYGTTEVSAGKWLSFSPQEFTIPPFSKRKISYTIKIPMDAKGGYYGVLFFEKNDPGQLDRTGVQVVTRVGCLFFIETQDKEKKARVEDITISDNNIQGNFLNAGNVIAIPEGIHYTLDAEGIVVSRGKLEKMYIPPGQRASFSIPVESDLSPAQYTTILTFDLGEGDSIVKEVDFLKESSVAIKLLELRD